MVELIDGGPAFPAQNNKGFRSGGMSLREWFAGQALAGLIERSNESNEVLAETCFAVADAMMAARAESQS
jgi:hypothetical protein